VNVLVTGAAGYIGSIVTEELIRESYTVIALDNLKEGHREAVDPEAIFVQVDLGNLEDLDEVLRRYPVDAVMHLAAESLVAHSMTDPKRYFQSNVVYGINLLNAMLEHGVHKLIFSSTAAVYGRPEKIPIKESDPARPVNAYGESKLMFEKVLHWYGHAYGLKSVSLRYFNAAGASRRLGEDHNPETHLIPNILKVASEHQDHIPVFGTDYETKDGTCIRDYIHVLDIAKAHALALTYLETNNSNKVFNLGNGEGFSVIEVIETTRRVTGAKIPVVDHPRRPGDPPILVANSDLARKELKWQPEYPELEAIIGSAWEWHKEHPNVYRP